MNLLAVFCILSWRVFWITMTNRTAPDADPQWVFTVMELRILNRLVRDKSSNYVRQDSLSYYLLKLARLVATWREMATPLQATKPSGED